MAMIARRIQATVPAAFAMNAYALRARHQLVDVPPHLCAHSVAVRLHAHGGVVDLTQMRTGGLCLGKRGVTALDWALAPVAFGVHHELNGDLRLLTLRCSDRQAARGHRDC